MTASVLLCVAHFRGQRACGDRADSRDAHQALSDLVLSELACELLVNLTDLFLKVLEVLVEAFEESQLAGAAVPAWRAQPADV